MAVRLYLFGILIVLVGIATCATGNQAHASSSFVGGHTTDHPVFDWCLGVVVDIKKEISRENLPPQVVLIEEKLNCESFDDLTHATSSLPNQGFQTTEELCFHVCHILANFKAMAPKPEDMNDFWNYILHTDPEGICHFAGTKEGLCPKNEPPQLIANAVRMGITPTPPNTPERSAEEEDDPRSLLRFSRRSKATLRRRKGRRRATLDTTSPCNCFGWCVRGTEERQRLLTRNGVELSPHHGTNVLHREVTVDDEEGAGYGSSASNSRETSETVLNPLTITEQGQPEDSHRRARPRSRSPVPELRLPLRVSVNTDTGVIDPSLFMGGTLASSSVRASMDEQTETKTYVVDVPFNAEARGLTSSSPGSIGMEHEPYATLMIKTNDHVSKRKFLQHEASIMKTLCPIFENGGYDNVGAEEENMRNDEDLALEDDDDSSSVSTTKIEAVRTCVHPHIQQFLGEIEEADIPQFIGDVLGEGTGTGNALAFVNYNPRQERSEQGFEFAGTSDGGISGQLRFTFDVDEEDEDSFVEVAFDADENEIKEQLNTIAKKVGLFVEGVTRTTENGDMVVTFLDSDYSRHTRSLPPKLRVELKEAVSGGGGANVYEKSTDALNAYSVFFENKNRDDFLTPKMCNTQVKVLLRMLRQIAGALAAAHEEGIVHGSVHLKNIYVSGDLDDCKTWDFYLGGWGAAWMTTDDGKSEEVNNDEDTRVEETVGGGGGAEERPLTPKASGLQYFNSATDIEPNFDADLNLRFDEPPFNPSNKIFMETAPPEIEQKHPCRPLASGDIFSFGAMVRLLAEELNSIAESVDSPFSPVTMPSVESAGSVSSLESSSVESPVQSPVFRHRGGFTSLAAESHQRTSWKFQRSDGEKLIAWADEFILKRNGLGCNNPHNVFEGHELRRWICTTRLDSSQSFFSSDEESYRSVTPEHPATESGLDRVDSEIRDAQLSPPSPRVVETTLDDHCNPSAISDYIKMSYAGTSMEMAMTAQHTTARTDKELKIFLDYLTYVEFKLPFLEQDRTLL